jgi:hypothetical protein
MVVNTHREINKTTLHLDCLCGGEILRVEKYSDEEEVYITVFSFKSHNLSFWQKLRNLFSCEMVTCDLVLSLEEFKKLKSFETN